MARGILGQGSKPRFEFAYEDIDQIPGIMVVDNFCPDPEKVRQSALVAGFGTWRPSKGEVGSSVYDGMCFWGEHALMNEALTRHFGHAIAVNSVFFRVTNADTEAAYVHSDREAGDYTAIVYLSEHGDAHTGTGFYRHRETGQIRMKSFAEMAKEPDFEKFKDQMVRGSDEDWEMIKFVNGQFNRGVIFEAPLFHARHPRHGFAKTPEEGRMVWVCHFNIVRGIRG